MADLMEAIVLTAYLKPLVDKHHANNLITYEDLNQAYSAATAALNRQESGGIDTIREKLRSIHQQQVEAYKKAAIENMQSWAEKANSVDSLPLWRLVPQSIVDSAKQKVTSRVSTASTKPESQGETEEGEEAEMVEDDTEEKKSEEEGKGDEDDSPDEATEDTSSTPAVVETTKETSNEPPKGKSKPKGGILAKKQAARGKVVTAKKVQQQVKSPPPQTKRGRQVRKGRATAPSK